MWVCHRRRLCVRVWLIRPNWTRKVLSQFGLWRAVIIAELVSAPLDLRSGVFSSAWRIMMCSYDLSELYMCVPMWLPQNANLRFVLLQTLFLDCYQFFLEEEADCRYDSLNVYDGSTAQLLGRFCGLKGPRSLISSGNMMFITFKTDSSGTTAGFRCMYIASEENYYSRMKITYLSIKLTLNSVITTNCILHRNLLAVQNTATAIDWCNCNISIR